MSGVLHFETALSFGSLGELHIYSETYGWEPRPGFRGRVAVYEVMELREELKEFVLNGASSLELKREAIRLGMKTLRQCALSKLAEGVTTLSEVFRVSTADQ